MRGCLPFLGLLCEGTTEGSLAETPSATSRLLLFPQGLQKGPGLRLLSAPNLGSFTQGNKHRGNWVAAETVLTGAKDFANWK